MFIGEYQHSIDDKGRLTMPSKFRDELKSEFFITKGMDKCLFLFTKAEWDKIDEKISALQLSRSEARAFSRLFYAGAMNTMLDKQSRILLPMNLREYAGIEKEVVIIGVSTRIELWSKENWDQYANNDFMNYDTLTEKMVDLNI